LTLLVVAAAALTAASGFGVVLNRRPLYSALSLVVNMLSLALLFVALSAQFLAVAQIIVYAGAVMVLFVFVIALLNPGRDQAVSREPVQVGLAAVLAAAFTGLSAALFLLAGGSVLGAAGAGSVASSFGGIESLGGALYGDFAFPFEITSLVLVVAAVGAVYLSRGR
jgi:NADH-quinone oxidoreductase subunit J